MHQAYSEQGSSQIIDFYCFNLNADFMFINFNVVKTEAHIVAQTNCEL